MQRPIPPKKLPYTPSRSPAQIAITREMGAPVTSMRSGNLGGGTGITEKELKRLAGVLGPLQVPKMPLAEPPSRDSRFGSPLKLSRVQWVRPEVVVEVTYLTWTEDNLLQQVSYQGQREDKPARKVLRPVPHPTRSQ